MMINDTLNWKDNIENITRKACKRIYFTRMLKRANVPREDIILFYEAYIRSCLCYGAPVWHSSITQAQSDSLEAIQRRAYRIIYPHLPYTEALVLAGKLSLKDYREGLVSRFFNDILQSRQGALFDTLQKHQSTSLNMRLRHRRQFIFRCHTERFRKSFLPYYCSKYQL